MTAALEDLKNKAYAFRSKMAETRKSLDVPFSWYLYDIISNIWHIDPMLTDGLDRLFEPGKRIADIGAADGDISFFLESLGNHCDIYDNPPTNMNNLMVSPSNSFSFSAGSSYHKAISEIRM